MNFVNENYTYCSQAIIFQKQLTCIPWTQRSEKAFYAHMKVGQKNVWIRRQLKYHQHRIRSEIGISLEIIH